MLSKWKERDLLWHGLPVLALVIWGALCCTNNLWYDEAYSAALVSQPWQRLVYITAVDAHSPFYYIPLKLLYELCGGGTRFFVLKLVSLLFMMGYMLLGKYYVDRLFDRRVSVWFMFFSLCAPIMSVQAGNVRMYAMGLFFMTLTGLLMYDTYRQPTGHKWFFLCLASIATVYCHTFALIQCFILYLLFFAVLLYKKQYEKLKGFFLCGGIVAIVFSPWLWVTYKQMTMRMTNDVGSAVNRANLSSLWDYCKEWFSAVETPILPVAYLGVALCVTMLVLGGIWTKKNHHYAVALGVSSLGLTVLVGFLVSVFINNCFMGRYVFPGFGFLMLFYAVGMVALKSKCMKGVIVAATLLCFGLQYQSEVALEYDKGLDAYEDFWEENVTEEDVMIGPYTHTIFLNVYHPEITYYILGYKNYKLPFQNTQALVDYNELKDVKGNIWYVGFGDERPHQLEHLCDYEEKIRFQHMYYDFVIYQLDWRE